MSTTDHTPIAHDEGRFQLQRLQETLAAVQTRIANQVQRYASAATPAERADVLHGAIVDIEDRLSAREHASQLAAVRDAIRTLAGLNRHG